MSKFEQRYIVQDLESHEFIYPDPFGDIGFTANLKAAGKYESYEDALSAGVVSTHSRPKAAGGEAEQTRWDFGVSTHSRPKAAGPSRATLHRLFLVSTHSRPKAAGQWLWRCVCAHRVSTHSRPKAAGMITP